MTTIPDTASRRSPWTGILLVLVGVPATLALALFGALALGPIGLVAPLVLGPAIYLYRAVVVSTHSNETRATAREIGAVVLAPVFGFGAYVALMILGVATGILPFIGRSRDGHPYEDLWNTGSPVVAVAVAFGAWWLLRSWADDTVPD